MLFAIKAVALLLLVLGSVLVGYILWWSETRRTE